MEEEIFPHSFSEAIYYLSTPSFSITIKLNTLRYILSFLEKENHLSINERIKLNQLLLDTILYIIQREDTIPDLRKRQLIKTECFLMLSKLLQSNTLFSGVKNKYEDDLNISLESKNSLNDSRNTLNIIQSHDDITIPSPTKNLSYNESSNVENKSDSSFENENKIKKKKKFQSKTNLLSQSTSQLPILSSTLPDEFLPPNTNSSNDSFEHQQLFSKTFDQVRSNSSPSKRKTFYKPRQSVLLGSKLRQERIVPGIDPHNVIAIDKQLGYQKSRLWVPFSGPDLNHNLLPKPRPKGHRALQAEKIAQDYLKMRALMSYVSDLVLPYTKTNGPRLSRTNPDASKALMDPSLYNEAVKEAIALWTPLLGLNIPRWVQSAIDQKSAERVVRSFPNDSSTKKISSSTQLKDSSNLSDSMDISKIYNDTIQISSVQSSESSIDTSLSQQKIIHSVLHGVPQPDQIHQQMAQEGSRAILISKQTLKKLLREELLLQRQNKEQFRRILDDVSSGDPTISSISDYVTNIQTKILQNLSQQRQTNLFAIDTYQNLLYNTIKIQSSSYPPRYHLTIEPIINLSSSSSTTTTPMVQSRQKFLLSISKLCDLKRLNYLSLAMGIWKILLIDKEILERRPKYAKIASIHLMKSWVQNKKIKQINLWFKRWKETVSKGIYLEREHSVLPIQCLYRQWRDRNKFIRLHLAGPYNGPLSDIYLGPQRFVKYRIPRLIRATRRMLWSAAILIQTQWRRYWIQKDFLVQLRRVILLQSIVRMYPKWVQYRRLKRITIKCQAWARRTVKRNFFKLLKIKTIIVQKYVRRYLAILLKMRLLNLEWIKLEDPMSAIIKLQCRWRIYRAKIKVKALRDHLELRERSALYIQSLWYKRNHAFHTFVLMSAYRVTEINENRLEDLSEQMGRVYSSRKIQREYRKHYNKRVISSAIKIQCWYRGTRGYRVVEKLRREKWAARKLHHWARVMMKYKHRCSRIIARAWWKAKRGRFIRHIHAVARRLDLEEDKKRKQIEYYAAERIQSLCHLINAKYYVIRYKAALVIQKGFRPYINKLMWKKRFKDMSQSVVRKIVNNALGRGLILATKRVMIIHTIKVIVLQRYIRGYIVRAIMKRQRKWALVLGKSIIKIQRFWRSSGEFLKAVQEVMALKKYESNVYRNDETVHEVLLHLQRDIQKYYSSIDPRVGLLTTQFLKRIGLSDLIPFFTSSNFKSCKYILDFKIKYNAEKLFDLYEKWIRKLEKTQDKEKNKNMKKWNKNVFIDIMGYLWAKSPPTTQKGKDSIKGIFAVQEVLSQQEFSQFISDSFIKRFGTSFSSRAENLAASLSLKAWTDYSNYKSVGPVLTMAHVSRALSIPKVPAEVKNLIEEMSTEGTIPPLVLNPLGVLSYPKTFDPTLKSNKEALNEKQWDYDRVKSCVEYLQMAVEKLLILLPEGVLRDMISTTASNVASYKRRYQFIVVKIREKEAKKQHVLASRQISATKTSKASLKGAKTPNSRVRPGSRPSNNLQDNSIVSQLTQTTTVTYDDDTSITGKSVQSEKSLNSNNTTTILSLSQPNSTIPLSEIDLDMNIGICKIYFETLSKLMISTTGINGFKKIYYNKQIFKKFKTIKINQILERETVKYLEMKKTNFVQITWNKLRKKEQIDLKLEEMALQRQQYREMIHYQLEWIPRYGWLEKLNENGYPYWENTITGETSNTMPTYVQKDWFYAIKIQNLVNKYLQKVYEKKRLRELQKQEAILAQERLLIEQFKSTQSALTVKISITKNLINSILKRGPLYRIGKKNPSKSSTSTVTSTLSNQGSSSIESLLPFRYQFIQTDIFQVQEWVLFKMNSLQNNNNSNNNNNNNLNNNVTTTSTTTTMTNQYHNYKIVLILKYNKTKFKYDVRLKSGVIMKGISPSSLFKYNYDIGTEVEARYKGNTLFYKGKIVSLQKSLTSEEYEYNIRYSDGEKEVRVPRKFIRPTENSVVEFFTERKKLLSFYEIRQKRLIFYENAKKLRDDKRITAVQDAELKFSSYWKSSLKLENSITLPPGQSLRGMIDTTQILNRLQYEGHCRIYYTRLCLKFGWFEEKMTIPDENSNPLVYYYYKNYNTGEELKTPPIYTPVDHYYACKIQSIWAVYKAKKYMKSLLIQDSIINIAYSAIMRYQQVSYIGYNLEGVTTPQILYRCGFVDLAQSIETYFKSRPHLYREFLPNHLLNLPKEKYSSIGVTKHSDVKDLERYKEWYNSLTNEKYLSGIKFINSYNNYSDMRLMKECIQSGEQYIRNKLNKAFKNSVSRIQNILTSILNSKYPITRFQLDSFIEMFNGKPGVAQDNVFLIVDKPTTHTFEEERDSYVLLKGATRRILAILKVSKMTLLQRFIKREEDEATRIVLECDKETLKYGNKREKMSGLEARAALRLRVEVMEYIIRVEEAIVLLQKRFRGITKRLAFLKLQVKRLKSIIRIQCTIRKKIALLISKKLREQQQSEWEQLWNDREKCLYYYNRVTKLSTYEEPMGLYRPLVRDRLSDALVQSWPFLDELEAMSRGGTAISKIRPQSSIISSTTVPEEDEYIPEEDRINQEQLHVLTTSSRTSATSMYRDYTVCSYCEERKTLRLCFECDYPEGRLQPFSPYKSLSPSTPGKYGRKMPVPYCFPCFATVHSNDPTRINHRFKDLENHNANYLKCCECNEPATRKCLGILDDKEIDDICNKLHHTHAEKLKHILQQTNIGGDKRLTMMLSQLTDNSHHTNTNTNANTDQNSTNYQYLTVNQIQHIRMLLERTRAECDECYCDRCYQDIHRGGKRAHHRWLGFSPDTVICNICEHAPGEYICSECNSAVYCRACCKVFHHKGRKRKHQINLYKEVIDETTDTYCKICQRRKSTVNCYNCLNSFCNSCYECKHISSCNNESLNHRNEYNVNANVNVNDIKLCVQCNDTADKQCIQCGDYYCSRTWMGNPGCFETYHSKGNRVNHQVRMLITNESEEEIPLKEVKKNKIPKKFNPIK